MIVQDCKLYVTYVMHCFLPRVSTATKTSVKIKRADQKETRPIAKSCVLLANATNWRTNGPTDQLTDGPKKRLIELRACVVQSRQSRWLHTIFLRSETKLMLGFCQNKADRYKLHASGNQRQTDWQTNRPMDQLTNRPTDQWTNRPMDRQSLL